MIVIDTSALLAILLAEPEATAFRQAIERADAVLLPAINYVEAVCVLSRVSGGREILDEWLHTAAIDTISVDGALARLAADAHERFGRGRHPAGLNFGDCFSYATAKANGALLLFKGDDFARTDIRPAI
jgi:ribonuclease VapC